MQMLAAWLLNEEEYRGRVFKGVGHVISLSALQAELESAWKAGFDTHGAADFGGRVIGGSAWIGSSEVWALLRHYGIRARVMRFGTATLDASAAVASAAQSSAAAGNAAKRPRLVQSTLTNGMLAQAAKAPLPSDMQRKLLLWVWRYFSEGNAAAGGAQKVGVVHRPPLYFQHEGHSRTIVGIERRRDRHDKATYMLLVLDPAIPRGKLLASLTNSQGRWQSVCLIFVFYCYALYFRSRSALFSHDYLSRQNIRRVSPHTPLAFCFSTAAHQAEHESVAKILL